MSDGPTTDFAAPGDERLASRQGVPWLWRAAGLAVLALLAAALYWTIRLSRADWLFRTGNPQFIQQAIRLAPGNPDYYSGWAQREPERAVDILEKGVALNPIHSSLRIELGLAAEEKGDFRKAEASLLEAMRLDKKVAGGEIQFVLARRIGQVEPGYKVAPELIQEVLTERGQPNSP